MLRFLLRHWDFATPAQRGRIFLSWYLHSFLHLMGVVVMLLGSAMVAMLAAGGASIPLGMLNHVAPCGLWNVVAHLVGLGVFLACVRRSVMAFRRQRARFLDGLAREVTLSSQRSAAAGGTSSSATSFHPLLRVPVGGLPALEAQVRPNRSWIVLVVVMVVLGGGSAAMAMPHFLAFKCRAKQSEAKTALKAIMTVERAWHEEQGEYLGGDDLVARGGLDARTLSGAKYYRYRIARSAAGFRAYAVDTQTRINTRRPRHDVWFVNESLAKPEHVDDACEP